MGYDVSQINYDVFELSKQMSGGDIPVPPERKTENLLQSRQDKIDTLSFKQDQYKNDTLLGVYDADSPITKSLGEIRESAGNIRYDANELTHGNNAYGAGKSPYAMKTQRENTATLLGIPVTQVTNQDMIDVGNRQQIQKLTLAAGGNPNDVPLIRNSVQLNLSGKGYKDPTGKLINGTGEIPLNIPIKSAWGGETDNTSSHRKLAALMNPTTKQDITRAAALDYSQNAFAPSPEQMVKSNNNKTAYEEELKRQADRMGVMDEIKYGAKVFGKTMYDQLISQPAKFLSDTTGLLQENESARQQRLDKMFGINKLEQVKQQESQAKMESHINTIFDSKTKGADKAKAALNILTDSITDIGMGATSFATVFSYILPASLIGKATKAGSAARATMRTIDASVEAGEISRSAAALQKLKLLTTTKEGAVETARLQTGQVLTAIGETNKQYDEWVANNNGVEPEGGRTGFIAKNLPMQLVNQNLDSLVDLNIIKSPKVLSAAKEIITSATDKQMLNMAKGIGKTVAHLGKDMGSEAAQEYTQQMMEMFNTRYGSEAFKDQDSFIKFVTADKQVKEATLAAIQGAGGAVQFKAVGSILPTTGKIVNTLTPKSNTSITNNIDATPSSIYNEPKAELAKEARDSLASITEHVKNGTADVDMFTKLEDIITGIDPEDKLNGKFRDVLLDDFNRQKSIFASGISNLDESINFGSSRKAKDTLKLYIENNKNIDDKAMAKLEKIALNNGVTKDEFDKIKTYQTVEEEATIGTRGYNTVEKELNRLIEVEPDNAKDIVKKIKQLENFKDTQEAHVAQMKKAVTNATTAVNTFNTSKGQVSGKLSPLKTKDGSYSYTHTYDVNGKPQTYTVYADTIDGKLEVRPDTKIFDSKQKYVNDMNKILSDKYKYVKERFKDNKEIADDVGTMTDSTLLHIPSTGVDLTNKNVTSTQKAIEQSRITDRNVGATKAIVLESDLVDHNKDKTKDKGSKQTNSKWVTYASKNLNKDKINTDTFTEDDVVLVSASKPIIIRDTNKKEVLTEEGKALKALIDKAMNAGATIVVDSNIGSRSKEALIAIGQLKKQIRRYAKTNEENQAIGNKVEYTPIRKSIPSKDKTKKLDSQHVTAKTNRYVPKTKAAELNKKLEEEITKSNLVSKDKAKRKRAVQALYAKAITAQPAEKEAATKAYEEAFNSLYEGESPVYKAHKGDDVTATTNENGESFKDVTKRGLETTVKNLINSKAKAVLKEIVAKGKNAVYEDSATFMGLGKTYQNIIGDIVDKALAQLANMPEVLSAYAKTVDETLDETEQEIAAAEWDSIAEKYGITDKKILSEVFDNSVSKDVPNNYVVFKRDEYGNVDSGKTTNKIDDIKFAEEGKPGIVRIMQNVNDVSKIIQDITKSTMTLLNTIPVEYLGRAAVIYSKDAVDALKKILLKEVKSKGAVLTRSPGYGLLFDKDMNINENVALAMKLSLDEALDLNSHMLSSHFKSKDDIANMLGIEPTQVSRELMDLISSKGMLQSTLVETVGNGIKAKLGLKQQDVGVEFDTFDRLIADLANMIIYAEIHNKNGLLVEEKVNTNDFASAAFNTKSHLSDKNETAFIREKNHEPLTGVTDAGVKNKDGSLQLYKEIMEEIPQLGTFKKGASIVNDNITDKKVNEIVDKKVETKTIRNDKAGFSIAKKAKNALKAFMKIMWKVDTDRITEMLDNQEEYKKIVGWKDLTDPEIIDNMSYAEIDQQVSINRDIERSFEALKDIMATDGIKQKILMFDWFYSKNGRYMLDSNTLNPQTEKQMHRWVLYPKNSMLTYKVEGNTFKYNGLDVSDKMYYAFAQAFGVDSDKSADTRLATFGNTLLDYVKEHGVADIKKALIKDGSFKINDNIKLKMEHLGHTLVALDVLEQFSKGNKITSHFTAEFDAVTSGFGLKLFIMPLLSNKNNNLREYLTRVGFITQDQIDALKAANKLNPDISIDKLVMGTLLDKDGTIEGQSGAAIKDTYVNLASNDKVKSIPTLSVKSAIDMIETNSAKKDSGKGKATAMSLGTLREGNSLFKNIWTPMSKLLPAPEVDGAVGKALRDLFKQPFMEFNYSAGLRGIRASLSAAISDAIVTKMMDKDNGEGQALGKAILDQVKDAPTDDVRKLLRENSLDSIKLRNGTSLRTYLETVVNLTYGDAIEEIFKTEFNDYIETNKVINASFNTMFEVFNLALQDKITEIRKNNNYVLDNKAMKDAIAELITKGMFPMIKGPLSDADDLLSFIGVYSTDKISRRDTIGVQTQLDKEVVGQGSKTVTHSTKGIIEGGNAGAVIPIHFLDAAIMWYVTTKMREKGHDILGIHDATIGSLVNSGEITKLYNEGIYKIVMGNDSELQFDFIKALEEAVDTLTKGSTAYTDRDINNTTKQLSKTEGKPPAKVKVKDALDVLKKELTRVNKDITSNKAKVQTMMRNGVIVAHAAGTLDGVFNPNPTTKVESKDNTATINKVNAIEEIEKCIKVKVN